VPIKFIGVGEKLDALETYHPDRLATRILGMGDVLTLIERAQQTMDQEQAAALQKKLRTASFTLNDYLVQLRQLRQMGPLDQILDMIPGMSRFLKTQNMPAITEKELKRVEAIILSMTPQEREHPEIIGGSRKRRIARGSGTTPADINQLLNTHRQMQQMMKQMSSGKLPRHLSRLFR
jgi:signal recognition particle subunit SRP54